jgi:hypothetical protein
MRAGGGYGDHAGGFVISSPVDAHNPNGENHSDLTFIPAIVSSASAGELHVLPELPGCSG